MPLSIGPIYFWSCTVSYHQIQNLTMMLEISCGNKSFADWEGFLTHL